MLEYLADIIITYPTTSVILSWYLSAFIGYVIHVSTTPNEDKWGAKDYSLKSLLDYREDSRNKHKQEEFLKRLEQKKKQELEKKEAEEEKKKEEERELAILECPPHTNIIKNYCFFDSQKILYTNSTYYFFREQFQFSDGSYKNFGIDSNLYGSGVLPRGHRFFIKGITLEVNNIPDDGVFVSQEPQPRCVQISSIFKEISDNASITLQHGNREKLTLRLGQILSKDTSSARYTLGDPIKIDEAEIFIFRFTNNFSKRFEFIFPLKLTLYAFGDLYSPACG